MVEKVSSLYARYDMTSTHWSSLPRLPRGGWLLGIVALFAVASALVYGASLQYGFVRWDDGLLIYENPAVMEISTASITRAFTTYDPELYIPFTLLTYQFDYLIGDGAAWPFKLGNLLLHTLNALLVGWLGFLLLGRRWLGVLLGLVFLLHPLHTEAALWASARKDVLSTACFFGSILTYLYAHDRSSRLLWMVSIGLFVLGLMAKVMVITLPLVLLLLDDLRRRPLSLKLILEKWPYWVASVVFGVIAIVGKEQIVESTSMTQKILMAFNSAFFYLPNMLVPRHYSLLYPFTGDITLADSRFVLAVGSILLLLIVAAIARYSEKSRLLWFGIIVYLLTLAPTFLNFAKGGDLDIYIASDRYAYIPSFGVFLILVGALSFLWKKLAHRSTAQWMITGISVVLVMFLSFKSFAQSKVWADTETLFQNVIDHYPNASYVAYNNIGNAHRTEGDMDASIAAYEQAIEIRPHAKVISNLGAAYRKQGEYQKAQAAYHWAMSLDEESADAYFGLGIVQQEQGQLQEAEASYRKAIEFDPTYEEVRTNLGVLLLNQRRYTEAEESLLLALQVNPSYAEAQYNLAILLHEMGRTQEAIDAYERAIDLSPRTISGRVNLGILLAEQGELERSRRAFREILQLDPDNATAREALRQLEQ